MDNNTVADKISTLEQSKKDKFSVLGNYDGDSLVVDTGDGITTGRLTTPYYYPQAPELKDGDQVTKDGLLAKYHAEQFITGKPLGEATQSDIRKAVEQGDLTVTPTGEVGKYGRPLYTAERPDTGVNMADEMIYSGNASRVQTEGQKTNAFLGKEVSAVIPEDLQAARISKLGGQDYSQYGQTSSLQIPEAVSSGYLNLSSRGAELLGEAVETAGQGVEALGDWQQAYNERNPAIEGDGVSKGIHDISAWFAEGLQTAGQAISAEGTQIQEEQQDWQKAGAYDELVGYDSAPVQQLGGEFADLVEEGNYLEAVAHLADPRAFTAFAASAPEMIVMANPLGLGGVMAANANNALNTLEANAKAKGQEVTAEDKALSMALSIVGTALDRLGDKATLSSVGGVKKLLKGLSPAIGKKVGAILGNQLKAAGIEIASILPKALFEGATEGAQTILEEKASDKELMTFSITDDEQRKALEATGIGIAAGGVPSTVTSAKAVIEAPVETLKDNIRRKVDEVPTEAPVQETPASTEQLDEARRNLYRQDGSLDTKVLGANPKLIEEYFGSVISAKSDEDAEAQISKLVNSKELSANTEELQAIANSLREARSKQNSLADGISSVRADIIESGFNTGANDYESMIDQYVKIVSGDQSAKTQVTSFLGSQNQKLDNLRETYENTKEDLKTKVAQVANQRGMSPEDAAFALAYLSKATIPDDRVGRVRGVNLSQEFEYGRVIPLAAQLMKEGINPNEKIADVGARLRNKFENSPLADKLDSKSFKEATYANAFLGKHDGKFQFNIREFFGDIANDVAPQGERFGKSSGKGLMDAIQTEIDAIQDMLVSAEKESENLGELSRILSGLTEPTKAEVVPTEEVKEESKAEKKKPATLLEAYEKGNESTKLKIVKDIIKNNRKSTPEIEQVMSNASADGLLTKASQELYQELKNEQDLIEAEKLQAEGKPLAGAKEKPKAKKKAKPVDKETESKQKIAGLQKSVDSVKESISEQDETINALYKTYNKLTKDLVDENKELFEATKELQVQKAEIKKRLAQVKYQINQARKKQVNAENAADVAESIAGNWKIFGQIVDQITKFASMIAKLVGKESKILGELKAVDKELDYIYKKMASNKRRRQKTFEELGIPKLVELKERRKLSLELTKDLLTEEKETLKEIQSDYKGAERTEAKLEDTETKRVYGWSNAAGYTKDGRIPPLTKFLETSKSTISEIAAKALTDIKSEYLKVKTAKHVKTLQDTFDNYVKKVKKVNQKVLHKNDPAHSLIFSDVDENGKPKIDENVVAAMYTALLEWTDSVGHMGTEIDEKMAAKYYGVEETEITQDMLKAINEIGIPAKFIANDLGRAAMQILGLKVKTRVDKEGNIVKDDKGIPQFVKGGLEANEVLAGSLGLHILEMGQAEGFVNVKDLQVGKLSEALGIETETKNAEAIMQTVTFKDEIKVADEYKQLKKDVVLPNTVEDASFVPFAEDSIKNDIRRNELTYAPEELFESKKDFMQTEWHLKAVDGDHSALGELIKLGRKHVMALQGYNANVDGLVFHRRQAAESKNRAIEKSVDALFDMYEKIDEGVENNKFWFKWFIAKSNRLMIDSNRVNPQTDKLHRSFVFTDKQKSKVDLKGRSFDIFRLAIGQAMGYDIDKMSLAQSLKFADAVLEQSDKIEAHWEALKKDPNATFELEYTDVNGNPKTQEIHGESISHFLDGLEGIQQYKKANGKAFETTLLLEADAVTSGFGLKLLQVIGEDVSLGTEDAKLTPKEWLEKTGIFYGMDKDYEFAELLETGKVVDSYKTLGKDMTEDAIKTKLHELKYTKDKKKRKALTAKLGYSLSDNALVKGWSSVHGLLGNLLDEDGMVTKLARDLSKYPFMTFNYGAGMAKVRAELYGVISDKLFEKIEAFDGKDPAVRGLIGTLFKGSGLSMKQILPMLKEKHWSEIKVGNTTLEQRLQGIIDASYGEVVEEQLQREFSYMVETNEVINNTMRAVFGSWKKEFMESIHDIVKEEGSLSKDAIEQAVKELAGKFPIIKGPLSKGYKDGIAIFKKTLLTSLDEFDNMNQGPYGKAGAIVARDGESVSRTVARIAQVFDEAASAGAVIPIHTLDAAIITETTKGKGVLEIHDAIMLGITNAESIVKDYNQRVFEMSMNWNYLAEVENLLNRVVESTAYPIPEVSDLQDSLRAKVEANKKFKEMLKKSKVNIQHMLLTKDAGWSNDVKAERKEPFGKMSIKDAKKIMECK